MKGEDAQGGRRALRPGAEDSKRNNLLDRIDLIDPCLGSRKLVTVLEPDHGIKVNRKQPIAAAARDRPRDDHEPSISGGIPSSASCRRAPVPWIPHHLAM